MNRLLLILFFASTFQLLQAQVDSVVVTPSFLAKMPEKLVPKFDTSRQNSYIVYLPMNYAKFLLTDEDKRMFETLSDTIVERIDLVYTVFRRDESFDQEKLNRERYEMLQKFFPEAFNNNLIDWQLIAQDGAADYAEARTYFHGFVIYIKPHRLTDKDGMIVESALDPKLEDPDAGVRELYENEEIEKVKKLLTQNRAGKATKIVQDTIYERVKKRKWTGYYLHKNIKKRRKGKRFKKKRKGRPKQYTTTFVKEMKVVEKEVPDPDAKPEKKPTEVIKQVTDDTVVYSVLERTMDRWDDHVIVQDVTGSMYPYLTQTLLYLQNHIKASETEKFVFFNDGDANPDGYVGRSGGCYYVSSDKVSDIETMAYEAMENGRGGKAPENDTEAMLYGIRKFPNCKGIVLIADNYSRVRDLVLIKQLMKVGKPVRVIVCGIAHGDVVNLDYIYLAKLTGGSIHTINEDITNLATKKDGDVFKIGSQYFHIEGKTIKLLSQNKRTYKRF